MLLLLYVLGGGVGFISAKVGKFIRGVITKYYECPRVF